MHTAVITYSKIVAAVVLGILGLLMLLSSATLLFTLEQDVEQNRSIYAAFERTAAYVSDNAGADGRLPIRDLEKWQAKQGPEWYWSRIAVGNGGCEEDGFQKAQGDTFVLQLWRGEWFDCFAFPSRKTTLDLSLGEFLAGGLGWQMGIWFIVGCCLTWFGLRMERSARRRSE